MKEDDNKMKWVHQDLKKYLEAKEYVDTLILPLIPFQLSDEDNVLKGANQNEATLVIMNEIEKELSGRVLLIPAYYYLQSADKEAELKRLNGWLEKLSEQPFNHIFTITSDLKWKKHDKDLAGELLMIPGIQSGDIHSKEVVTVIRDQVSQISELIRSYW